MRFLRALARLVIELAVSIAALPFLFDACVVALLPIYVYRVTVRCHGRILQRTFRGGRVLELADFAEAHPDQELLDYRFWYVWDPDRVRVVYSEEDP